MSPRSLGGCGQYGGLVVLDLVRVLLCRMRSGALGLACLVRESRRSTSRAKDPPLPGPFRHSRLSVINQ